VITSNPINEYLTDENLRVERNNNIVKNIKNSKEQNFTCNGITCMLCTYLRGEKNVAGKIM
jgi:hypothetical protein